ncbi:hypothetical protein GPJ56_009241 [Histomonas meleagridis]|uniref:uncharacterized protein n=1 Tax=Histomonas meleagridis TaxID=135588 RepID=UPI0035598A99|nr:hypothetical protein GPJ56_009241 [Histomonas meleagridis]KAH0801612.1 hypothetical protein GO595_005611 [Histomonas meleagridis]
MFIQGFDLESQTSNIETTHNGEKNFQEMVVGANGHYMNQYYQITSKSKIQGVKIPNPRRFASYEKYKIGFNNYVNSSDKLYKFSILPIPVSEFMHKPPMPPLSIKIPDYKARVDVPPDNLLYLSDICISGACFVPNASLPAKLGNRFEVPISTMIVSTPQWNSQVITHPPIPECYDTFEDFQKAYLSWYELSKSAALLPSHPDSMKEFIQLQPQKEFPKPPEPDTASETISVRSSRKKRRIPRGHHRMTMPVRATLNPKYIFQIDSKSKLLLQNVFNLSLLQYPRIKTHLRFNKKVTFDFLTQTPTDEIQNICDYGCETPVNNFDVIMSVKQTFRIQDPTEVHIDPCSSDFLQYLEKVIISKSPALNYQCLLIIESIFKNNSDTFISYLYEDLQMFYYITSVVAVYSLTPFAVAKPSDFSNSKHSQILNEFQKVLLHHHYMTIIAKTFITCVQISSKIGVCLASTQGDLWDYLKNFDKNIPLMFLESNTNDFSASLFRLLLIVPCPYTKQILSQYNQDMFRYLNTLSSKSPTHFNALVYIIYNSKSMNFWFLEQFTFFAQEPKFKDFNSHFIAFVKTLLKYFKAERLEFCGWLSPFYTFLLENNYISLLPHIARFVKMYHINLPEVEKHINQMLISSANEISSNRISSHILVSFAALLEYKTSLKVLPNLATLISPLSKYLIVNNEELAKASWKVYRSFATAYPKKFYEFAKAERANGKMMEVFKKFDPNTFYEFSKLVDKISRKGGEEALGQAKQRRKSFGFINVVPNRILKELAKGLKKANVQYTQLISCMNRKNQPKAQQAIDMLFVK